MRLFIIIATRTQTAARVSFDMEVRIRVEAPTLQDAYKAVRKYPEFKYAFLRPE
jgi:hypothetical protein